MKKNKFKREFGYKHSKARSGDGGLPNKYWVTGSNGYYVKYNNETHWIGDKFPFFVVVNKILNAFNKPYDALNCAEYYRVHTVGGFWANTLRLEDRLRGVYVEWSKVRDLEHDTLEFIKYTNPKEEE